MYNAYVTTIKNLRKHPNADRLQLGECFGNTVCVSLDIYPGEIGIYFPSDLQLSEEFCDQNHLCRKTATGEPDTGYLERNKRNVTAIKLRGEKSDGIFMPLQCLVYTGVNMDILNPGDTIDVVNGHEICRKYIPRGSKQVRQGNVSEGNRPRKKKAPIAPLFVEHADTKQLAYNLGAFKAGDEIEITLKMHGTSQRTGYLPILKKYKRSLLDRILGRDGTPVYDWGYVSGTRRTVLNDWDGGFYGSNAFREPHAKIFEGKLHKGEEVFYEVVGFTHTGAPIMASCDNKKLNDKEFIKQYGKETVFSYGCEPKQSDMYVYRMTMTNEDGNVVEYTPEFMRHRCEQMGVNCVPVMWRGFVYGNGDNTVGDSVTKLAEDYYDGPDPIGKTHVREGVVVRIVNRPKFAAYKHKNFSFKALSSIAIADLEKSADIDNMSNDILEEM